jgi:hypothetical protein
MGKVIDLDYKVETKTALHCVVERPKENVDRQIANLDDFNIAKLLITHKATPDLRYSYGSNGSIVLNFGACWLE